MPSPPADSQPLFADRPHAAADARPGDPLRIGISLPGGLGPGTYEAGAVCGLLAWVQEVNAARPGSAVVDVVSGASAGALTALLAARVLLSGDDPVAVYRQAWVTAPSLRALRGLGQRAPLSLRAARSVARDLIFARPDPEARWTQANPVTLDIALTCLRGFSSPISTEQDSIETIEPPLSSTHLDWSEYTLASVPSSDDAPDGSPTTWQDAVESAITSASHPLLFPTSLLDRQRERSRYAANGYVNLPETPDRLNLWYTDGGLVDNEPLGRCVSQVARIDGRDNPMRLVVLVRSSMRLPPPANSAAWTGKEHPRWAQTLIRALDLGSTQAAGRDLYLVAQTNVRLRAIEALAREFSGLLVDNESTRGRLESLRRTIAQTTAFGRPVDESAPAAGARPDLANLVETLVRSACGLAGSRIVRVALVTPEDGYPGPTALRSLFGFIHRKDRDAHFAAGYWNMLNWIERTDALNVGLEPAVIRAALRASQGKLRKPYVTRLAQTHRPSFRTWAQLTRIGLKALSISLADVRSILSERESTPGGNAARRRRRR